RSFEHLLAAVDLLDGLPAGLWIGERRETIHQLVADALEVSRIDDPIGIASGEVDRYALPGRPDRGVGARLRPVDRLRERDLAVQPKRVVDLARDLANRPPLHRPEHHVRGAEF